MLDLLNWEEEEVLGILNFKSKSLVLTIAFNVYREKTTKDLMAALSKMYEKLSASNKVFLMKKLFNPK